MSVHSQKDRNRGIKKPLRFQLGHRTSESTCDALGEGRGYGNVKYPMDYHLLLVNVRTKLAILVFLFVCFEKNLYFCGRF